MTFKISGAVCKISKGRSDKLFRTDSSVFYTLRNLMRSRGYDIVKRNMEQDGHLMGDRFTFYIRDRKGRFAIYDADYAIRSTAKDLNANGSVLLTFHKFEEVSQ